MERRKPMGRKERREQERLAKKIARRNPSSKLSQRYPRRIFLGATATAAAGLGAYALLRALGIPSSDSEPTSTEFAAGYEYSHLPTREEFLETFSELPESPLKNLLVERIRPFFAETPPVSVERFSIPIDVRTPLLGIRKANLAIEDVAGHATIFDELPPSRIVLEPSSLHIPYPGYLSEEELRNFHDKLPDGTAYLPLDLAEGQNINYGIKPQIYLELPSPLVISIFPSEEQDTAKRLPKFLMIKEASTLLAIDLSMEFITKEMQRNGEFPVVRTAEQGKPINNTNILPHVIHNLGALNGRYWSSIDKAGVVLAYHAIKGDGPIPTFLIEGNQPIRQVKTDLDQLTLGVDPIGIYKQTMKWCASPVSETLPHIGQMNS